MKERLSIYSMLVRYVFAILLSFLIIPASGQDLISSRQSSPYTYIYRLTNKEAAIVLKKKSVHWLERGEYFHTLVDSFPTWSEYQKPLAPGNYLKVYSQKNRIKAEMTSVMNIIVQIVNNNTDLCLQLYDSNGVITSGAEVKIGAKQMRFNRTVNGYLLKKSNRKGTLEITYQGVANFFDLERQMKNPWIKRAEGKVLLGTPIKYIWIPVKVIVSVPIRLGRSLFSDYYYTPLRNLGRRIGNLFSGKRYNYNGKGYFVFNKPKYLPGDTVKLKAFIVNRHGKPENRELNVYIDRGRAEDIKLGKIEPLKPGSYSFRFLIADSLDLDLDNNYNIHLRKGVSKTLRYGSFRYEDYELKSVNLKVTHSSASHIRGNGFNVRIRGTDENDLNILDGRLEITLIPGEVKRIFNGKVFVPDTLLFHKMSLEQVGETVFQIPDSIFPKANLNYSLEVKMLRSDNEYKRYSKETVFYDRITDVAYELDGDSITFFLKENGKNAEGEAVLSGEDQFGNVYGKKSIKLPYSDKINPCFGLYRVSAGDFTKTLTISQGQSEMNCISSVMNDTLSFYISNPRDLPFNWFLYRANHPEGKGYGNKLDYKKKISRGSRYFLTLVYLWAGETRSETFDMTGNENDLNIKVDQPALVFPGQKVKVDITVTDHFGSPVQGVDLTAFSSTKKFGYNPPGIAGFPDRRKSKDLINIFDLERKSIGKDTEARLKLELWGKSVSLDTIEYYKFLYHNDDIYYYSYKPADGFTQFAPFVVKDGQLKGINIIYIDNVPVYYSWTRNENKSWSFRVDPGYHLVQLRTSDKLFTIDSVRFTNGMKLIMSIKDIKKPVAYTSKTVENTLDKYEKLNLERYIFPYRNNFGDDYAWLKQGDKIFMLNTPDEQRTGYSGSYYSAKEQRWHQDVSGPLTSQMTDIKIAGGYNHYFLNEHGYEYEFSSSVIKMRTIEKKNLFPYVLYRDPVERLSDIPLTEKRIMDGYNEYQFKKKLLTAKFSIPGFTKPGNGKLVIETDSLSNHLGLEPLFLALMWNNDQYNIRVYPGNTQVIHDLDPGPFSLVLMFRGEKYARYDSLEIKPGGRNIYYLKRPGKLDQDDFGRKLYQVIENKVYYTYNQNDTQFQNYIRQLQVQQSITRYSGDGRVISGVVNSSEGPLPGAMVVVKGTTIGTVTDLNGLYTLKVPEGNKFLLFTFIGFKTQEREISSETLNVTLAPEILGLDEVVVVGYGMSRKANLTGASVTTVQNSLAGRVAGVQISGNNELKVIIRGYSSFPGGGQPLFIIDGKPYLGDISALDPAMIKDIQVVKDESLIKLYGAMAANGVIMITTSGADLTKLAIKPFLKGAEYDQEFMQQVASSGSIRSNFSDYAYWRPDLVTDKNGKASFNVKFPDDVTGWSTFVMAMNGKRQSGQTRGSIKSYKPLMAQLFTPRFLLEGDSSNLIGKILNYTPDTLTVTSSIEINGQITGTKTRECINAINDTIPLLAQSGDTIKAKYYFTKSDGYLDGEERTIPVFRKGIEMTKGEFFVLDRDTTVTIVPDPSLGVGTIYAQADQLDIVNYEISRLYAYNYECNEQLASKLKALLANETICKFQDKAFDHKLQVNRIIRILQKNQNRDGCWGWWDKSETSIWISGHVINALMQAKYKGYNVQINMQALLDYVIWKLESKLENRDKLDLLWLMSFTDAKLNYPFYLSGLDEDSFKSLTEKFRLIELRQILGLKYSADSVLKYERKTMFGNVYFGKPEGRYSVCYNETQTTLTAYRIIRRDSLKDESYLRKIRNFFLEQRRLGRWQNTFETASIIENILPDLLVKKVDEIRKQKLVLTGTVKKTIEEFPFELKIGNRDSITISKSGTYPLYLTSYQHYWKSKPSVDSSDFIIETWFKDNNMGMTAGKPEKMMVSLEVKNDAQYVIAEIPIPGGCSYESKAGYFRGSCHTEFYKDHVSIFFENIRPGNYEYEIDLLPRYTGKYTINPAKAELMYFPLFSSNNSLKQIIIK